MLAAHTLEYMREAELPSTVSLHTCKPFTRRNR